MTCHWAITAAIAASDCCLTRKKIESSEGIRNKDRAELPTGCSHGADVCLFVKQQCQRLAHSCPGKISNAKYRNERGPGFRQGLSITARVMPGIHPNRMSFRKGAACQQGRGRTAAVPAFNSRDRATSREASYADPRPRFPSLPSVSSHLTLARFTAPRRRFRRCGCVPLARVRRQRSCRLRFGPSWRPP